MMVFMASSPLPAEPAAPASMSAALRASIPTVASPRITSIGRRANASERSQGWRRTLPPESEATVFEHERTLPEIFADVPSHEFARSTLDGDGLLLVEALKATGLAAGTTAARRTVEQGGAYVNNRRVTDVAHRLTAADLVGSSTLVLRSGKKSYAVARFA
jgi:tyrosyl-tRNA synthetase